MAIAAYFHPKALTTAKYDEAMAALTAAGAGAPKGRLYHSCFGDAKDLMVYEVFDSRENFEAFGQTLMPILAKLGIDPGQPDVMAVHNTVIGA